MTIDRRQFIRLSAGAVAIGMVNIHAAGIDSRPAASKAMRKLPIIDVHMHAYPADEALPASLVNPVTGKPTSAEGRGGALAGLSCRDEASERRERCRERRVR